LTWLIDADKVTIVLDNLNMHHPSSLYEAFASTEAKSLADRFQFHYTPEHGGGLNKVWIVVIPIRRCFGKKSQRGKHAAMSKRYELIGALYG
jgi:hypothetical protein